MDIKELYKIYQQHPVITTDSRDCPQGSIFIALKGESFNGNAFAGKALEQGCAYAVVDEPQVVDERLKDRYILVDDCLQTFKDLAREHRRQFDIPVIGITGTNGKTTTKELVAAVLSEEYNVMATQGNFNNDVGVPKTLFRLTDEHDIAVVEMGASHPGDIKTLVETAEPTCGLITNVGRAHLQGFGSFEGVKRTKGELYDFLRSRAEEGDPDQGFIFINADDPDLTQMANQRGLIFQIGYGMGNSDEIVVKGEGHWPLYVLDKKNYESIDHIDHWADFDDFCDCFAYKATDRSSYSYNLKPFVEIGDVVFCPSSILS